MTNLKKTLLLLFLSVFSIWIYPSDNRSKGGDFAISEKADKQEGTIDTMTLTVTINSLYKAKMQHVPSKGYLEVYSILGKREKRIKLDDSNGEISIDLSKGLYILKAEKITQKIRIQ